jgi:hypothetical protein
VSRSEQGELRGGNDQAAARMAAGLHHLGCTEGHEVQGGLAHAAPFGLAGPGLKAREHVETEWDVVFPSQLAKLRDRLNASGDLCDLLDPLGLEWVTSHTFRRTAATLMEEGGLTIRETSSDTPP